MLLKTLLNRVEKFKSLVYEQVRKEDGGEALEIEVAERASARAVCSGCGHVRPG